MAIPFGRGDNDRSRQARDCYNARMPTPDDGQRDQPGHVATSRDSRYSLTIEEAAELYAKAGHPRTLRTIQRYCASGHLDAIKVATALGDKYFIDPTSLSRHVAQIEELSQFEFRTTDRDLSRHVATHVAQEIAGDIARPETATGPDMSPPVARPSSEEIQAPSDAIARQPATIETPVSPPVAPAQPDVSRYVAGLEREVERLLEDKNFDREQIKTKDSQIAALLERDRETNILVRGLQQMIPQLLGIAPRQRHDGDTQNDV